MAKLIDKIKRELRSTGIRERSSDSRAWLFANVKKLVSSNIRPQQFLNQPDMLTIKPLPGRMYMFLYDPKLKDELPYYDRFPLVFVIKHYKDGFLALNLHYLQPILRLKLFEALLDLTSNEAYNDRTRLRLSWRVLTNFARSDYARVCVKRYLYDHLRSKFIVVPPEDWEVAVFLPTEMFKSGNMRYSRKDVWDTTRGKVL